MSDSFSFRVSLKKIKLGSSFFIQKRGQKKKKKKEKLACKFAMVGLEMSLGLSL